MNYGELKLYVRGYVNRTDLTDSLFDTWNSMAQARVFRDVRSLFLDQSATISNPAGTTVFPVSDDLQYTMQDVISVSIDASSLAGGFNKVLQAVSWERFIEVQAEGAVYGITEPEVYCMFANGFKVAPGNQASFVFNVVFRAADKALSDDADTNQILTYAPQVFIDAVLIEVYKYLRDVEGEQLATTRYQSEALAYSNYYDWQHSGENAISKGAWSWA